MNLTLGADLAKLVRMWRVLINQRLKPMKLTYTHWLTLYSIHRSPTEQSQIQLAKIIGIEQPSLVRTLDQLEEKNLIFRLTCVGDRRAKQIKLTEIAVPLIEEVSKIIDNTRKEVLLGVNHNEIMILARLINHLENNITKLHNV